jgi:hypothetical protein
MKMLIKEVEGDGDVTPKKRLLSFKEFCQYVYEPSQRIKALNLPEEERLELDETIERRKR